MRTQQVANAIVLQSGGCSPVFNRSLAGLVSEAAERGAFGAVYGAVHGLDGLLRDEAIDLLSPSRAAWRRIAASPGAALGSSRRRLKDDDVPRVLDALDRRRTGYVFIIGGNDSAETGLRLQRAAEAAGRDLAVVNVPKTVDNDLACTDHTPGYGSAARFVALATMGAGRDAEAMGAEAPITILEVMGRDAGWLAAAAALGRTDERDAPHFVGVPEVPLDETRFLDLMEDACRRFGFAVAVVAENARGVAGPLGAEAPFHADQFGHLYFDGPARHLAALASRKLRVRARHEKPGTVQRSMAPCVSRVDAREAEMAGRAAVAAALAGQTGVMVTLERATGPVYGCTTGTAPLANVAGQVRTLPAAYLDADGTQPSRAFVEYAMPLIGASLPRWGRLPSRDSGRAVAASSAL